MYFHIYVWFYAYFIYNKKYIIYSMKWFYANYEFGLNETGKWYTMQNKCYN